MLTQNPRIVASWVAGTAIRHATHRPFDLTAAVEEVKRIEGVTPAILAEVAGFYLGSIEGKPSSSWSHPLAAQICFEAGADLALVPGAIERARARSKVGWSGITLPDESVRRRAESTPSPPSTPAGRKSSGSGR